eukprot:629270-Prorocentrum_lima.AAC.1
MDAALERLVDPPCPSRRRRSTWSINCEMKLAQELFMILYMWFLKIVSQIVLRSIQLNRAS